MLQSAEEECHTHICLKGRMPSASYNVADDPRDCQRGSTTLNALFLLPDRDDSWCIVESLCAFQSEKLAKAAVPIAHSDACARPGCYVA